MDGVEDASEETLRFGSWSSAYIKLGAPSVCDCFNINLDEKVTSAVDTRADVLDNLIISVNQERTSTNKKNPRTKYCVLVSAAIVDRGPCRHLPCKLAFDKTFRFTRRQKGSYTSKHPTEKRTATKAFDVSSGNRLCRR